MADADVRWLQRLDNYGRALGALQLAVATARERPLSELEEQGLIQSFEFSHELSWLLLKDFLSDQGVSGVSGCGSSPSRWLRCPSSAAPAPPLHAPLHARRHGSRNLTSHTYNPALVKEIAELIVERYAPALLELQISMQARAAQR